MIETICSNCSNKKSFDDSFNGRTFKCPKCSKPVKIEQKINTETNNKLASAVINPEIVSKVSDDKSDGVSNLHKPVIRGEKKSSSAIFFYIIIGLGILVFILYKMEKRPINEEQFAAVDTTTITNPGANEYGLDTSTALTGIEPLMTQAADVLDSITYQDNYDNVNDYSNTDENNFSLENAKSVYLDFANAFIEENYNNITSHLAYNLNVWHTKVNISRDDILEELRRYYFNKWRVIGFEIISMTPGEYDGKFFYTINYKIQAKSNPDKIIEYLIDGYFTLNAEYKIIEIKDLSTNRQG
jgi:hypothetical protein